MVISEQYTLKTSNSQEGILKMVSEFPPTGIIGAGKEPASTVLLEVILGDHLTTSSKYCPASSSSGPARTRKKNLGLDQSSGAPPGALYIGWNPIRCRLPLSGYQQDPCWSGRVQKAEVHARRPLLRAKVGGPYPFELTRKRVILSDDGTLPTS